MISTDFVPSLQWMPKLVTQHLEIYWSLQVSSSWADPSLTSSSAHQTGNALNQLFAGSDTTDEADNSVIISGFQMQKHFTSLL